MYENHQQGFNLHSTYKNPKYNHHTEEEENEYVVKLEENEETYMDMGGHAQEDPSYYNTGYIEETYEVPETPANPYEVSQRSDDNYVALEEDAEEAYANMNGDSSSTINSGTNIDCNSLPNTNNSTFISPSSSSNHVQQMAKSLDRGCQNTMLLNKVGTRSRIPSQKYNSHPASVHIDRSPILPAPTLKIKSQPPISPMSILEEHVPQSQKDVAETEEVYGTQWQREVGGGNEAENMAATPDERNDVAEEMSKDCYSYPYMRDARDGIEVQENRVEPGNENFEMTPIVSSPSHINEDGLNYSRKKRKRGKGKRRNFLMLTYKVLIILLLAAIVGLMYLQYETLKNIKTEIKTNNVVATTSSAVWTQEKLGTTTTSKTTTTNKTATTSKTTTTSKTRTKSKTKTTSKTPTQRKPTTKA